MNTFRLFAPPFAAAVVSAVALLSPVVARASVSCTQDADCGKGLICQSTGPALCPAIDCAPNQPCTQPACDTTPVKACVPGPCSADGDCASGMVCFGLPQTTCPTQPAPTCAAGVKCPPPAVELDAGACTTTTVSSCVPRYVLPCHADADCGDGFTCVADQSCGSSGSSVGVGGTASSGGAPTPGSGSNGSTPPSSAPSTPAAGDDAGGATPQATCTALPTSHCEAKTINCTTVADCPAMWACVAPATSSSGCAVAHYPDGGTSGPCTPPPPPPPAQSVCQPPYADLGIGQTLRDNSTSSGTGTPPNAAPAGGESHATGASGAGPSSQGGCQLGSGRADTSGAAWMALFGLAAFARRRLHAASRALRQAALR